jgi:general secretion pathway protein K
MTNKGTVLITVLWVILVLSIVAVLLAASVRAEMAASVNSFDSDRALYMAKGAAEVVYSRFAKTADKEEITRDAPIREENGEYVIVFESGEVRVHLESAAAFIDLNGATDKLLASMFDSIGIDEERRNRLVDSILDWRDSDNIPHLYGAETAEYADQNKLKVSYPRNAPFASVDELLLVKNMTPDVFYGSVRKDPITGEYRRIPGVRDMVTVDSGKYYINPNEASRNVLAALPMMPAEIPDRILAERKTKRFTDVSDFVMRVPEISTSEALPYIAFDNQVSGAVVSTATISSSQTTRTVRLLFREEQKMRIYSMNPVFYVWVRDVQFDRWRF